MYSKDPFRGLFEEIGSLVPGEKGSYEKETPEIIVIALKEYISKLKNDIEILKESKGIR